MPIASGVVWPAMAARWATALWLALGGVESKPLFARNSTQQFDKIYWPQMKALFLEEGAGKYPVPSSDKVTDLLPGLRGVKGLMVHTSPDVTVTEGQGYAMFAAGMARDLESLKGLTVGWQAIGQGFEDTPACGGCGVNKDQYFPAKDICTGKYKTPCLCRTVPGAYMPGWDSPFTAPGSMGSATDGDEDAVTGLIYLAEMTGSDEFREYAVKSIAAFVLEDLGYADPEKNSRPVPVKGDIPPPLQTMYLWRGGSCWGGYDTSSPDLPEDRNLCINPAYFSPGEWRLFQAYLSMHSQFVPAPYTANELVEVLESAIVWGYNTINRIACPTGLVSNWWTVPNQGWPWKGGLKCKNSGTESGAYYSDAARLPWRVALDYIWFADEATAPLFDENGMKIGTWGAKEYSNRWASSWKQVIVAKTSAGAYPPMKSGVLPLRKDQVLPLLSDVEPCSTCPKGFTASPWNAWGSYSVATSFQVPLDDVEADTMQQWTEFIAHLSSDGCTTGQYFDLGQQVIVSQMLGGRAWRPLSGAPAVLTKFGSGRLAESGGAAGGRRLPTAAVATLAGLIAVGFGAVAAFARRAWRQPEVGYSAQLALASAE